MKTVRVRLPWFIALPLALVLTAIGLTVGAAVLGYAVIIGLAYAALSAICAVGRAFKPSPRVRSWRDRASAGRLIRRF